MIRSSGRLLSRKALYQIESMNAYKLSLRLFNGVRQPLLQQPYQSRKVHRFGQVRIKARFFTPQLVGSTALTRLGNDQQMGTPGLGTNGPADGIVIQIRHG